MGMIVELTDGEAAALRRRAAREGQSVEDVLRQALQEYLGQRPDRVALATARVIAEDAELLLRLSI